MDTDNRLLERYAEEGSESAFREFVDRHINLVHSAAVRESRGDRSLAEDITQAVFTELARRAPSLIRHPAIAGWLYTCVRRTTANIRRAEERRHRREQETFTMTQVFGQDSADDLWQQVRPVLDDVMHELDEEDRAAVVLRFFEGQKLNDVGAALGVTENAARMRVDRSLERLRALLSERGVKSTASTLSAVLATGAATTAPATLASTVATGALTAAVTGDAMPFGIAKLLSMTKTQIAAGTLVVLVGGLALWQQIRPKDARLEPRRQAQPSAIDATTTLVTDAGAQDSLTTPRVTSTRTLSQMALTIVDADTGGPLPGAKLHLAYLYQDGRTEGVKRITDANGRVGVDTVQLPFRGVNMFVTADGHVPKVISWGFGRVMPAKYTMKMERGLTVSGVITDEAGRPIAGATIEFDSPHGNDNARPENIQFGPDAKSVSGDNGRWSCNMIPKDFERILLVVTHTEYSRTAASIELGTPEATNAVVVMKRGFTVTGIVEDANGSPIAEAKAREVRLNSEGERSTTSDRSGNFALDRMTAGELIVAVQAKGFAPAAQTLQITGPLANVRFQLGPGQLLRGRVVDEAGGPIPNAWVEVTRKAIDKVQWSTRTDADGRFKWDSAPEEPLHYSFQAEGFNRGYAIELKADGSEHEIKLTREQPGDAIEITGTVVDAETGQPVDDFTVLVADVTPDWTLPLRFGAAGKTGTFNFSMPAKSSHSGYQLQIEKEGYLPELSADFQKKDGGRTLAFELRRGTGPFGYVFLPAGEPAVNAMVLLCTPQAGVSLSVPARVDIGLNTTRYRTQTDGTGRFSVPPGPDPQDLIVIHDEGFAQLPLSALDKAAHIVLEPWGQIEGRLVLDGKPVANERIIAANQVARFAKSGRRFSLLTFGFETTTDSSGRFSFDQMPPGKYRVFRRQKTAREPRIVYNSHEAKVVVNAGSITQVVLGGSGRAVVGRASFAADTVNIDWRGVPVQLTLQTGRELPVYPKRGDFSSPQAYIEAVESYLLVNEAQRRFVAFCQSDGSFRLPDVPAGTYKLNVTLRSSKPESVRPNDPDVSTEIASIIHEITVSEAPAGQRAEPLDIGTLKLHPSQATASAR